MQLASVDSDKCEPWSLSSWRQQVLPPHYSGSNSHLAVVGKRLSKRDVTTKLKALAELRSMCRCEQR